MVEPHYAGFWRRVGATLIDYVLFSMVLALLYAMFTGHTGVRIVVTDSGFTVTSTNEWLDNLFYFAVTVVMWVKLSGTPGKLLLGCHVLDAQTQKPVGWKQALLRYVGYFVSALPLGLGFFWIAWDKRKQGFHDKIAKTIVVFEPVIATHDESDKPLEQLLKEVR